MSQTLNAVGAELRHAARTLRRTPGFTAAVVGTLGVALGTIAGVYTVLDRVLLSPLPYRDPEQLVYVAAEAPGSEMKGEFGLAGEFYLQYKESSRLLEDFALYASFTNTLRAGDRAERVRIAVVTSSLFATLGAQPALGRLPEAEDEQRVAVISDALWRSWFAADPSVVGRTYDVAGQPRTIVGVMRPEFRFPTDGTLLWVPIEVKAEGLRPGQFGLAAVARMAAGADRAAVAAELTAIARGLPERFGGSPGYARLIEQHRAVVRPLLDEMLGPAARSLWILFAAGGDRPPDRLRQRGEPVHGPRRGPSARSRRAPRDRRLARAARAAAAGGGVRGGAAGGRPRRPPHRLEPACPAARRAGRPPPPRRGRPGRPDAALHAAGRARSRGVACGGAAALRGASPDLARLREGGRGSTARRRFARDGLVAAQTAMALVLLIGSGLLDAQLPRAARRRSRLRHARRVHVPVRAGTAGPQGRRELGPLPPRLPGPAGARCPAWRRSGSSRTSR